MKEPMIIGKTSADVINFAQQYLPKNPVIVEAGAFKGKDSCALAQHWPEGQVHVFEPVPELFEQVQAAAAAYSNITCYQVALSDKAGEAQLHMAQRPKRPGVVTQANCLLEPKERLEWSAFVYPETLTVPTITLDTWADKHNIRHVDFMWLDLQGFELAVLKAAKSLLSRVKVIYAEVNFVEAYEGQPKFAEVNAWLEEQGFMLVAKDFEDETSWFFGNGVWCLQTPKEEASDSDDDV